MKHLPVALVLSLCAAACVTTGDLREVADSVDALGAVVHDRTATQAQLDQKLAETKREIEGVAERVDQRTGDFIDRMTDPATALTALVLSAAGAVSTNTYRNAQRRKRGEPVAAPPGK